MTVLKKKPVNFFQVTGRITTDITINDRTNKNTGEKFVTATFAIAVNRGEESALLKIELSNKLAENMFKYQGKGSQVGIAGYLKLEKWNDKQTGEAKSCLCLKGSQTQYLSPKVVKVAEMAI
jgi:single-strand DNA-binding protein